VTLAPRSAMILAAGLGTRLRPLTDTIPKPLVEVGGRPLIDHALDRLAAAGVEHAVVNLHYKAEMIAEHLARRSRPRIELSEEAELLDTGGGVARALPLLGEAFLVVNSDDFLEPGVRPLRNREGEIAPYLFAGIQLLHRRLFDEVPGPVFSLVRLFDHAEKAGRLAAVVHDGEWYHVGTPQGLALTRRRLASRRQPVPCSTGR